MNATGLKKLKRVSFKPRILVLILSGLALMHMSIKLFRVDLHIPPWRSLHQFSLCQLVIAAQFPNHKIFCNESEKRETNLTILADLLRRNFQPKENTLANDDIVDQVQDQINLLQPPINRSMALFVANRTKKIRRPSLTSKIGKHSSRERVASVINVATVACGGWGIEMNIKSFIKSTVMFSKHLALNLIIFGDGLLNKLKPWLIQLKSEVNFAGWDFTFELHPVWFPNDEWKKFWGPCSTQRLFLPSLLPHVDSLLYMDADAIVISNVSNLWMTFGKMNRWQFISLVERAPYPAHGWYDKRSRVPYFGKRGVLSGYALMNLTRMRRFDFVTKSMAAYTLYKDKIHFTDQDIINIILHDAPERVHVLDCRYTLVPDSCGKVGKKNERICDYEKRPGPVCLCKTAKKGGVHVLHGAQRIFRNETNTFWKLAHRSMLKFNFTSDSALDLFKKLTKHFNSFDRPCFDLTGADMYRNALQYFHH